MRKGFTLIELMIVVAIIAVIAAIAIPSLMRSRMASHETSAVGALKTFLGAQTIFCKVPQYAADPRAKKYAVPYPDLCEIGWVATGAFVNEKDALKLIDTSFANASVKTLAVNHHPKAGYVFDDILTGPAGGYTQTVECGLAAAPAIYNRTGKMMFIIDSTGAIYQLDQKGTTGVYTAPLVAWPASTATWTTPD